VPKKRNFGAKIVDDICIGYASDGNTKRFVGTNFEISEIFNNIIIEARDVVYLDNIFPFKIRMSSVLSSSWKEVIDSEITSIMKKNLNSN